MTRTVDGDYEISTPLNIRLMKIGQPEKESQLGDGEFLQESGEEVQGGGEELRERSGELQGGGEESRGCRGELEDRDDCSSRRYTEDPADN